MYADGSEFSAKDLQTMDRIFARYSIPIHWQPGDIAVLDNITWTHARPPFVLEEGESLTQRVGVLVHKGDVQTGRVAERYQSYITGKWQE